MDWKEEVKKIVMGGCTDSDINEYIEGHPELNGKDVWDFVCDLRDSENCKGCIFVKIYGFGPCPNCSRRATLLDYFGLRK